MKALNWSEIHKAVDGKTEYIDCGINFYIKMIRYACTK